MPYALFENDERLTRPFRTEEEVWEAAERADLTTTDSRGGQVLDNNFEIKPCEANPDEAFAANGQDMFFPERLSEGHATSSDSARSAGIANKWLRPVKASS